MDPNAALAEIRRLVIAIDQAGTDTQLAAQLGEELAVTIDGLDTWLTAGGSAPVGWKVM